MDYLIFSIGTLFVFVLLSRFGWKGNPPKAVFVTVWSIVFGVLAAGWFLVNESDRCEHQRMQQALEGAAPTYAQEVGLMGHEEVIPGTSQDSPRYWKIASAQKRWLAANPA